MQQEPALVRFNSSPPFQPSLECRKRTRPRKNFDQHSPDQTGNMQAPENRTRMGKKSAKDHPQDEERVNKKNRGGEHAIEAGGDGNCVHTQILCGPLQLSTMYSTWTSGVATATVP